MQVQFGMIHNDPTEYPQLPFARNLDTGSVLLKEEWLRWAKAN
jgi:hypothetical protein